ncbi:MAG: HNH endonuclease [Hyphomicrobiaceae bacterium]
MFDEATRRTVFEKSNRLCHLCWQPIAYSNYGNHGARGAWEIDHSIPRAQGGTDHLNNLYAAHTRCNRSKQTRSSASVRRENGHTRPPMSAAALKELKAGDAWTGAFSVGLLGLRFGGIPGLLLGAAIGAAGAYAVKRGPG